MEYKKIRGHILSRLLGKALSELAALPGNHFASEIESMQATYGYMKDYMLDGAEDPARHSLFKSLLAKAYSLLNRMFVEENAGTSSRLFYQKLRTYRALPQLTVSSIVNKLEAFAENLAMLKLLGNEQSIDELCKKHDADSRDMFYLLWLSGEWNDDDRNTAIAFFESNQVTQADKLFAVSGLLLSLLRAFDTKKMLAVIVLCYAADPVLRARAYVAVLLTMREHAQLLDLFPEAINAFNVLADDATRRSEMLIVILQLLKALETKKIGKKFNEEIVPELFKKQSELKDSIGTEFIDMNSFNELKPEWGMEIEKTGVADKLKEMTELQQDGYDVYHGAFSHMKNFTFFNEFSNWFMPFDIHNHAVRQALPSGIGHGKSLLEMILASGTLCDSDKYSFCLMLGGVPESQRAMLASNLDFDAGSDDAPSDPNGKFIGAANSYVQDLYRFHKLHPQRTQFADPFDDLAAVAGIPFFEAVIATPSACQALAEAMFKHEHYEEALDYYNRYVSATKCNDAALFQKAAYCAQRLGRYDEAVRLYMQADSLLPENKWILSHIASCLALVGKLEDALEYYHLIELIDPSDTDASLQVCKCLIRMEEFTKALEKLRKIDFMLPGNPYVMRMMGWCLLEAGEWAAALSCYNKLASSTDNLTANDHVNAGHAAWGNGDVRAAYEHYAAAARIKGSAWLIATLDEDSRITAKAGIGPTEYDIMKDMVISAMPNDWNDKNNKTNI